MNTEKKMKTGKPDTKPTGDVKMTTSLDERIELKYLKFSNHKYCKPVVAMKLLVIVVEAWVIHK